MWRTGKRSRIWGCCYGGPGTVGEAVKRPRGRKKQPGHFEDEKGGRNKCQSKNEKGL